MPVLIVSRVLCQGIDVDKFGTERYRPLRDFWLDLTAKDCVIAWEGLLVAIGGALVRSWGGMVKQKSYGPDQEKEK